MGEAWARHWFGQRFVAAEVRSAGIGDIDILGDPRAAAEYGAHPFSRASAFAVEVMNEHDVDMSAHRTQRLNAELMDWADAVVVMEPEHADHARGLNPEAAAKIEGLWVHATGDLKTIWDPQGRSLDDYRASAQLIGDAVQRFVAAHLAARRRDR